MVFSDTLYGSVTIPDWLVPFIKSPEFLRLRGIRLSNVDSIEFKDFNTPTRWEHCISVAYLASLFATHAKLSETEKIHLMIAALYHDIATPPFAHTMEYVLSGFDHELESYRVLNHKESNNLNHSFPIFASQFPQFSKIAERVSRQIGVKIDVEEVAKLVMGEGKWGYAIKGTLDLDNIDNVIRGAAYMGLSINRDVPLELVKWLATKQCIPTNLKDDKNKHVKAWLQCRYYMYKKFYNSSDSELGRQAFLQHLIRRLLSYGISRTSLIFNTDDGLLRLMENVENDEALYHLKSQTYSVGLRDLVLKYHLLIDTQKVIEIAIETSEELRVVNNPLFSEWLEIHLRGNHFEPFVLVKKRRYDEEGLLFPLPAGSIIIFKINSNPLRYSQLPSWLQDKIRKDMVGEVLLKGINEHLNFELKKWMKTKPWQKLSHKREEDIKANLNHIINWDFKLSRNETLHSYPATFVHAIPASLIGALGLKGETILDPFGGSGVTAMEGIKQGCRVYTSDSNSVAHLIMESKFTYLEDNAVSFIKSIVRESICHDDNEYAPNRIDIVKWHHADTLKDLSRIYKFISLQGTQSVRLFLKVCFSDILNATTERKGRDFAYFADNTPLPKGTSHPQYVDAISLFLSKIKRNIQIAERTYALLEQQGKDVKEEFRRVHVYQKNATALRSEDLGLKDGSIDAVITSPPYLCMVDYTYGNRLPYYWMFPDEFEKDHKIEIGARRGRNNPIKAKANYLNDMRLFAKNCHQLLKQGGYLATVIGSPVAQQWAEYDVVGEVHQVFKEEGFGLLWVSTRQIQWHRNHGLAKLKEEKIAVHIKL